MDGADNAGLFIVQKHGDAVGDVYHERQSPLFGHKPVGGIRCLCAESVAIGIGCDYDGLFVHLPCDDKVVFGAAENFTGEAIIFTHVFGIVAAVFAEIPRRPHAPAHSAEAGREHVARGNFIAYHVDAVFVLLLCEHRVSY